MATFGQTSNNGSAQTYTSDRKLVSRFTPGTDGVITDATARMYAASAVNVPTRFVVYSDTAGEPDALLATSDETIWNSSSEIAVNFTFSGGAQINVYAGTYYWIGVHYDYTSAGVSVSRANTAGLVRSNNDAYSGGAADPFGATATTAGALDVYITYTEASALPDPPATVTATEDSGDADITWDNVSDETGFKVYKKSGSGEYYLLTTVGADVLTYTDTDVDPGYSYTYRVYSFNANGNSLTYTTSNTLTMSGSKSWRARIQGWIYPGPPSDDADEEYRDGRVIHTLKPEYFVVDGSGVLTQLNAPGDGENAYSTANTADVNNYSDDQYITVASGHANMSTLVADSTLRSNAVTTLVNLCTTAGYTGIELDWEGYASWTSTDYTNYKSFVVQLGTALQAVGLKLMIDGPPITNVTEQGYYEWLYEDFESIPEVDYITMMLYDYQYDYGAGSSVQPVSWMQDGVEWFKSKITDIDRIVIGMPAYGYHGTTGGYSLTIDTKDQSTAFTGYGTATRNADYEMTWVNSGTSYVYQDTSGLNSKRELIEDQGIKHISIWHLGGNDWPDAYPEIARSTGTTTGQIKVWDGSAFVAKPVKVWNGSSWVVKPVKHYNGSTWTETPY